MLPDVINTMKLQAVADIIGNQNVQIRRNHATAFWSLHYLSKLDLLKHILPDFVNVDGPSNPRPDPNPFARLEKVLSEMLNSTFGDPDPQPSFADPEPQPMLKDLLNDRKIMYSALKNLREGLSSALPRLDNEIARLERQIQ